VGAAGAGDEHDVGPLAVEHRAEVGGWRALFPAGGRWTARNSAAAGRTGRSVGVVFGSRTPLECSRLHSKFNLEKGAS